ncbi:MAG: MaoC/PaaZ C-terminal domain-containing protein [Chloroflexi bacterium]|nr:MaoC/PaaZ C-terminal domain-containing protein [Chloroflexota bacterium]
MEKLYFEDYTLGERFVSPARTITEADIINFASLTGDWHPLHTDVEYAKSTPFGERIAHGMLTLAIGTALLFRLGEHVHLPKSFIAFYGMDSVRFYNPVKIGDTIHCAMKISALDVKDEARGVISAVYNIQNQRNDDVVVFTARAVAGRRPTQEPQA